MMPPVSSKLLSLRVMAARMISSCQSYEIDEATRPVHPVVDGAVAEFPAGGLEIALERLIDAENEVQRPRDDERRLALDVGQRRVGGEADHRTIVQIANIVAADNKVRGRVPVVVCRAETDGDARQSRNRLDHPDQLRRSKNPTELAMAGRKIGDTDRPASTIGEHRRYHRGVAEILRLKIGHVVEHDIGETLLVVTCEQAAEDRIAVETRVAPPDQARGRVDERSRAAIPDDGEIEPVVRHEVANASLRDSCSSQCRTSVGRSKQKSAP